MLMSPTLAMDMATPLQARPVDYSTGSRYLDVLGHADAAVHSDRLRQQFAGLVAVAGERQGGGIQCGVLPHRRGVEPD